MVRSIRAALSPLLIISYMCGLNIMEFPIGYPRPWLSCLYHLLLWSTYCFFTMDILIFYIPYEWLSYKIFVSLNMLMGLLTLFTRLYYNKKFRNCLRKLTIVDETLEDLGTTTNYQKLDAKMARFVAGWFVTVLVLNLGDTIWWENIYSFRTGLYITLLTNYSTHINFIDDLIFGYTLGYIGLKFDQVNEHLQRLADGEFTDRERRIKRIWENTMMRSHRRFPNAPSSEFMAWIVMHLHLELCKISHEINSVFGIQITLKMACYFCFMAENIWELFFMFYNNNYTMKNKLFSIVGVILWLLVYTYRLLIINYSCDIVSNKANVTKDFINKVMYSTYNAEIREFVVQLSLQIIRAPLKFYGVGCFQFGYKFLHRFCTNILTFLIILIQTDPDKNLIS